MKTIDLFGMKCFENKNFKNHYLIFEKNMRIVHQKHLVIILSLL